MTSKDVSVIQMQMNLSVLNGTLVLTKQRSIMNQDFPSKCPNNYHIHNIVLETHYAHIDGILNDCEWNWY